MRTDKFVMRGQTPSGKDEVLNFSGFKPGYAYRLIEFELYPSANIGTGTYEMCAAITAGKSAVDPSNPNFLEEGLIATAVNDFSTAVDGQTRQSVINDTFLITQNLIISVFEDQTGMPVNWQCKFEPVKLSASEEAVANYKQFTISDG